MLYKIIFLVCILSMVGCKTNSAEQSNPNLNSNDSDTQGFEIGKDTNNDAYKNTPRLKDSLLLIDSSTVNAKYIIEFDDFKLSKIKDLSIIYNQNYTQNSTQATINSANLKNYFEINLESNQYYILQKKSLELVAEYKIEVYLQVSYHDSSNLDDFIEYHIIPQNYSSIQEPKIQNKQIIVYKEQLDDLGKIDRLYSIQSPATHFSILNARAEGQSNITAFEINNKGEILLVDDIQSLTQSKYKLEVQAKNSYGSSVAFVEIIIFNKCIDVYNYGCQFHIFATDENGTKGQDINLLKAWDMGISGKGIKVAILDKGIYGEHSFLHDSLEKGKSIDYTQNGFAQTDQVRYTHFHGTAVAGLIVQSNDKYSNSLKGVAYNAKYRSYNILENFTLSTIVDGLGRDCANIDVSNNSWGEEDDGYLHNSVSSAIHNAIKNCISKGRNGRGTIYVWAAGNGGYEKDNVNLDGYTRIPYVIPICVVDYRGKKTWYSEKGANLIVCSPGHGVYSTTTAQNSFKYFNGSSSAVPIISGVVALMLEANPFLGWRDISVILAKSARVNDIEDSDWQENGAGHWYNHNYGYGVVDAYKALQLAINWINIESKTYVHQIQTERQSLNTRPNYIIHNIIINSSSSNIRKMDKVQLHLEFSTENNITKSNFRSLEIELRSPSGTVVKLAEANENYATQSSNTIFGKISLMGAAFLDENPNGFWQLKIENKYLIPRLSIDGISMTIWGIE